MATSKILAVEDEATLREMLQFNLEKEGYSAITAADGVTALKLARSEHPDLIVLDIMLPKLDGFEVCRILRQEMTVPILMLTAKEDEIDRVLGLELGADDYMTKPFSMRELKARIKAMLRRMNMLQSPSEATIDIISAGDLTIDLTRHRVSIKGAVVEMKPKEFDLLAFLVRNRGHVYSRDALLEHVWGYDYAGGTRTVDVHIRWLREKIEANPSQPNRLITVRGIGYKFEG